LRLKGPWRKMDAVILLAYGLGYLLYSVELRAPPRSALGSTNFPSLFVVLGVLFKVVHFFSHGTRERYSPMLPLFSAILLVYEFYLLSSRLEACSTPASSPSSHQSASPFSATASRRRDAVRREERTVLDLDPRDFWRWTDLPSYLLCTAVLTILLLSCTSLVWTPGIPPWYRTALGLGSLLCDLLACVPRVLEDGQQKPSYLGLIGSAASTAALLATPVPPVLCLCPAAVCACELGVLGASAGLIRLLPGKAGLKGGRAV
jgi:hypothetical protein